MKKWNRILLLTLLVYCCVITVYFLTQPVNNTPASLQGTPADPATFMTQSEIIQTHQYSTIRYLAYFLGQPMDWLILFLLLATGAAYSWRDRITARIKQPFLSLAAYVTVLSLYTALLTLPLDAFLFYMKHHYGLTNMPILNWLWDLFKTFIVDTVMMIPIVAVVLYYLRKHARTWWVYLWLWSIPFTIFYVFITPVIIDPIFNDFKPLQNQELKQDILALAHQAEIPANDVFEVDVSKQTNTINAYVNGIGSTSRIVLWDTMLAKMNKDEILSIMAHEMGHYVKKHVYWGTLSAAAGNLIFFYLMHVLYNWMYVKTEDGGRLKSRHDLAALPMLMLIMSVLLFLSGPVQSAVSRVMEKQADEYGMAMIGNKEAEISTYQKLAKYNLSRTHPPGLVQLFLGTHPTIEERIVSVLRIP